jgi:hypothetical protein
MVAMGVGDKRNSSGLLGVQIYVDSFDAEFDAVSD